jgi:hypothetical protein
MGLVGGGGTIAANRVVHATLVFGPWCHDFFSLDIITIIMRRGGCKEERGTTCLTSKWQKDPFRTWGQEAYASFDPIPHNSGYQNWWFRFSSWKVQRACQCWLIEEGIRFNLVLAGYWKKHPGINLGVDNLSVSYSIF